jgi:hypothetical protein
MTNHPIVPPTELLDKWDSLPLSTEEIFVVAAQWGADQELEACLKWLVLRCYHSIPDVLRAARRPKPPSLKEQALGALETLNQAWTMPKELEAVITIRRALEALHD